MLWSEDETMEERHAREAWDIACARLDVANQLGWGVAMGSAGMLALLMHTYFAMLAVIPIYWLVTRQYVGAKKIAEDRMRVLTTNALRA